MTDLIIKKIEVPTAPEFNYDDIKAAVEEITNTYSNIAYTEDDIKAAKSDRAEINKLKKALDDKRKEVKKAFTKPLEDFETKIKELTGALDQTAKLIDSQVAEVENRQKEEKKAKIDAFITEAYKDLDTLPEFNPAWLNKSVSLKSIKEQIVADVEKLKSDIETLNKAYENSQFLFEGLKVLKTTKDLSLAITEIDKLTKREAEKQEFLKQTPLVPTPAPTPVLTPIPQPEPALQSQPKKYYTVELYCTLEEAKEVAAFMRSKGIQFKGK